MKIFQIEVTTTVYFYGDDFPDKIELASAVRDEIEMDNYDCNGTSLNTCENLPEDVLDSYPYGEGGNSKTVGEWLES